MHQPNLQKNALSPNRSLAYEDVRSDKSETNWLLLDYAGPREDRLVLTATGTGEEIRVLTWRWSDRKQGLAEIKGQLKDDNASFAYIRVKYANDAQSFREKFILVTWIGANVKVMRKAKLSVHAADVKQVLRAYSIDVPASSVLDLAEEPIVTRLRQAGGANYNRSDF
ncbi:SPOSA6832_02530 [Sporobolomyces salmonicolor]|uniref:SPOSA6832_02530-mRNA-1:cds n=1 Tax=Sporidiobolus salmonicolor TaxID=5005 RepID=A0A0D6EMC5_SPOSA|nr:SPOSA6832_02530 [Sporobolomyces salmonicolor]